MKRIKYGIHPLEQMGGICEKKKTRVKNVNARHENHYNYTC